MNYSNLNDQLIELHKHHYNNCIDFKLLIDGLNWKKYLIENPEEIFLFMQIYLKLKNYSQLTQIMLKP